MTDTNGLEPVSLGYIAEARLTVQAAADHLSPDRPVTLDSLHAAATELRHAIDNLSEWGAQINRAMTRVSGVFVDDHPLD